MEGNPQGERLNMYAPEFEYYRAASVAEAGNLLRKHPGAKLLAGGHSLIPLMKFRLASPPVLVDIGRIDGLKGIAVDKGTIRIGALTTHAEIASSAALAELCPVLTDAAGQIGDPAVRNRGTIGGNVAHADPASDWPTVLAALDARFNIAGSGGERTVDAAGFFQGMMATALGEHDLLTSIEVPARSVGQGMAYVKFAHPASRYAVIGVAASVSVNGGKCAASAIALGGLVPRPLRAASVERALIGQALSRDVIAQAASHVSEDLGSDILGDVFASANYRKAVADVWVRRALTRAAERSG
jgi:carbon-monoxide dehydrogenase medium subunit